MALGCGERSATGGGVGADRENAVHARRQRGRDQLGVGRLAQVEMGVAVDHAGSVSIGDQAGSDSTLLGYSTSSVLTRPSVPAPSCAPASATSGAPSASSSLPVLAGR